MADGIWGWLTLGGPVDEPNCWTLRSIQQRAIDTTADDLHHSRRRSSATIINISSWFKQKDDA
jgi:hypothetical protein